MNNSEADFFSEFLKMTNGREDKRESEGLDNIGFGEFVWADEKTTLMIARVGVVELCSKSIIVGWSKALGPR